MKVSKLFKTLDPVLIGQRTAAAQQNFDNVHKYCEYAVKISRQEDQPTMFVLTRDTNGLKLAGIEDTHDVFKLMDINVLANVDTGDIIPKMVDAIKLLEDFTFFKI